MRNDIGALRRAVAGAVLEPGDEGYDAARAPAMARFAHVRPRAVVRCAGEEHVARALDFARRAGLPVVPRGGGHCFAGRSSTEGILLDLTPLDTVAVAPDGRATIGAGARLAGVYAALHAHGLTLPAGCGPTVGIAGLTLGGGIGQLGRRYGLTCDRLRGARVVLADGRVVDCDANREPELFWALRGAGGGQFGVVTSLVFEPVPSPVATRFLLTWPAPAAAAVVSAWQRWAPDAPDGVNACLKVAAPANGGPVEVIVYGAALGDAAYSATQLRQLVTLAGTAPATEAHDTLPYPELKRALDGVGADGGGQPTSRSGFFREPLPEGAVAALLDLLTHDRPAGEHRELNFTPMGGAYNRVPEAATAFAHRAERFLLEHVAVHTGGSGTQWTERSRDAVLSWASGRVYPNFPDPDLAGWAEAYHGGNLARLRRVKRRYDPDGVFRFHQSL